MNPSQNDSFGSFSNGQGGYVGQPGVYSAESAVLNNGGGRRSKKWVVVLIAVLIFVAVAGGVFAVWKSGVVGGSTTDKFNLMANYILYGEIKNDEIGEFENSKNYYFSDEAMFNSSDTQYFEKVVALYDEFVSSTGNNRSSVVDDLGDIVSFFFAYSKMGAPTYVELSRGYEEKGRDVVDEYLAKKNQLFDYSNKISNEYMVLFDVFLNESLVSLESKSDDSTSAMYAYRHIASFLFSNSKLAEKYCFDINSLLKNEVEQ